MYSLTFCIRVATPAQYGRNGTDSLQIMYRPPFTNKGQIWCAIADPLSTHTCQILSRSVYSVALWRQKNPNFCHILHFGI